MSKERVGKWERGERERVAKKEIRGERAVAVAKKEMKGQRENGKEEDRRRESGKEGDKREHKDENGGGGRERVGKEIREERA